LRGVLVISFSKTNIIPVSFGADKKVVAVYGVYIVAV